MFPLFPKTDAHIGCRESSLSGLLVSSQSFEMEPPEFLRSPIVAPVLPSARPPSVVSLARSPPPRVNMFRLGCGGCSAVR